MSVGVEMVEAVVSSYVALLDQCEESRMVVESWGLVADEESYRAGLVRRRLLELVAEGTEVI